MNSLSRNDLQFFDLKEEIDVRYRRLPHWSQAGTLTFITFRADDSIPRSVLQVWIAARNGWLLKHGINPSLKDWRDAVTRLSGSQQREFRQLISSRWHDHLDDCHGKCILQKTEYAEIVANSLRHFNGQRYLLTDYVVMPNHVHLLAAFPTAKAMLKQCTSWKHFTATQLNEATGDTGRFWQQDGFDHLVRCEEEFLALRHYVADNPCKAKLATGQYLHESFPLT